MIIRTTKPVEWIGSSKRDLKRFPQEVRQKAGRELRRLQWGMSPLDWKPMHGIGSGVCEIRVHTRVEHRVIYVAKYEEAVYVLHAFEKRSRKTARSDIEAATRRLATLLHQRAAHRRNPES